jgi:hypothetical protein
MTDTNVMSAIKKLEVQLKQQESELAALKKSLEVPKKLEWPRAEDGDDYFIVEGGDIISTTEANSSVDDALHSDGNYFLTHEDAECFVRRWTARQRYERLAAVENGGRLHEFNLRVPNWYIYYSYDSREFRFFATLYNQDGVYFPTRSAAERVLAVLSAEEKHILFGAPMEGDGKCNY